MASCEVNSSSATPHAQLSRGTTLIAAGDIVGNGNGVSCSIQTRPAPLAVITAHHILLQSSMGVYIAFSHTLREMSNPLTEGGDVSAMYAGAACIAKPIPSPYNTLQASRGAKLPDKPIPPAATPAEVDAAQQ